MIPFNKIPVADLYAECRKMLSDEWGYIMGTAGILWTKSRQDAATDAMAKKYGSKWIGHRVADCSGVMVYIWKQHGMTIAHGSNSIARKYCGKRTKTPKPGYAAFKWKEKDTAKYPDGLGDFYHIGIVAEDGQNVYESRGTQAGFVLSAASSWYCFAPFDDVDYSGKDEEGTPLYEAKVSTPNGGRLNVRVAPGLNARIVGKIPCGETVDVWEDDGEWSRIGGDGLTGWVFNAYLEKTDAPAPEPAPDEIVMRYGVWVPCENMDQAVALAAAHPGAIFTAYKPSDN